MSALPLPYACPPGVKPGRWARWNEQQRSNALLTYWRGLDRHTRRQLEMKYQGGKLPGRIPQI